jgi:O-antigen/teichoic acid export membrane protein
MAEARTSTIDGASWKRKVAGNVGARVLALVSLAAATFIIARVGGPSEVGVYALLRVLPGLAGVVASCGLPGAVAYFLAGERRDPSLPRTIVVIACAGGVVGTVAWIATAPLLERLFFPNLPLWWVRVAGLTVLTQLLVATSKSCLQGRDDLPGANIVFVLEECMFLPAYAIVWAVAGTGYGVMIAGLLLADVATAVWAWRRLVRNGFFTGARRASYGLAREVAGYGLRAQIGGVVTLLNLRLDFVLLDVITGPAVLGMYAIASKYAELLKLPPAALTYVLYPRFSQDRPEVAAARARSLFGRAALLTVLLAVPLWVLAGWVLPSVYGAAFAGSVLPARIIIVGLATDGVAAVVTAFLYGVGRPGRNSIAMGAGLLITVVLDLVLIPAHGATGAAVASAVTYAATTVVLVAMFVSIAGAYRRSRLDAAADRRPRLDATVLPPPPRVDIAVLPPMIGGSE